MRIRKFNILLDSPTATFHAGTKVTGRILLWLDAPKNIKGIKIKIGGKSFVKWRKNEERNDKNEEVNYTSMERYLKKEYFLEGGENCKVRIASGYEHIYPFYADLPIQLPSSFEGKYGYVRYTITARLVRKWMFDIKEKVPFNVVTPLDLNNHPSARFPVDKNEEKTFFTPFNSNKGPLIINVKLPQTGFSIGQDIPVGINITNNSTIVIDSVELKVKKVEKWTVHHPRNDFRIYKAELIKKILEGVEPTSSKSYGEIINLGNMPFVNLNACEIINISYYLKVKACVKNICHKGLSTTIPLILGTTPIYHQEASFPQYTEYFPINPSTQWVGTTENYGPSQRSSLIINPPSMHDLNPPPYSLAVSMPQGPLPNNYAAFPYVPTLPQQSQLIPTLQNSQSGYSQPDYPQLDSSSGDTVSGRPSAPPSDMKCKN